MLKKQDASIVLVEKHSTRFFKCTQNNLGLNAPKLKRMPLNEINRITKLCGQMSLSNR